MKTTIIPIGMAVWMSILTMAAVAGRVSAQPATTIGAKQPDRTYTGLITSVDSKEHVLTVQKWALLNKTFNLGNSCTYTLVDRDTGTAGDLRPGQRVKVGYQDAHGVLVADSVVQQPMRDAGTVKSMDPIQHTLVLRVHGMDRTFKIANGCKVALRDDKIGGLGDIQTGDYVTVTYEDPNETPTARLIAQTSETFTGSLTAIDIEGRTVKAKGLFGSKKFDVGNNCAIVLDGKPDGKLSDLKPGEKLDFSFDEINGVNVANRIAPTEGSPKNVVVTEPSGGE